MKLQILRRSVQISALLVVAGIAVLSLYAHYRSARAIDDPQLMQGLRGEVITQAIHPFVEGLDKPQRFLDSNKGTIWSMRLMGIELTDPLAAAETIAATGRVHVPLLVSIIIPVLVTLVLGKVFCSWICPGYLFFEIACKLRGLLRLAELKPATVTFSHANKYIVLFVGLCVAAATSAPLFALVYPPAVISRVIHAWVFGTALSGMLIIFGVMVVFEMFVSPRWWCRAMCPGGALYGLIGWARLVRVKLDAERCDGCRDCIPVCEAGINPITQSSTIECDNCGVCIRHCTPDALRYTIGLPKRTPKERHRRSSGKAVSGACVGAILLPLMFASPASGHHILGLPHYSYKENYPQRPTLEYPATTGPYDVLLTSYPGVPVPGEPANIAVYVKHRESGGIYAEPVTMRVLRTKTFGDSDVIVPSTLCRRFDNEYKLQVTFPVDGEYIVELTMQVEGKVEVIPFLMIAGEPTAAASVVATTGVGLIVFMIVIRAIKIKRKRRQRQAATATATAIGAGAA